MRILRLLLLLPLLALVVRAQTTTPPQALPSTATIQSTFQNINNAFLYLDNKGTGGPTQACTSTNVGERYFRTDAAATFGSVYYCANTAVGVYSWDGPYGAQTGGSVTSIGLVMPGIYSVSPSTITSSGTFNVTLNNESQNLVWASPNGSTGAPSFRALVLADLPTIASTNLSDSANLARVTTGNTYSSSTLQNFSSAQIMLPVAAGFTANGSHMIGVDTTLGNPHIYAGTADSVVVTTTATPTNGDCAKWSNSLGLLQLVDGGPGCTTPSGSANLVYATPNGSSGNANLRALVDADLPGGTTGSGSVVLASSPTLITPNLGIPSAVSLLNATNLPLATGVTGYLSHSNIAATGVGAGSCTNCNLTYQADGTITAAANGTGGGGGTNTLYGATGQGTATATFGSNCSTSTPCNIGGFGSQMTQVTASNTLTAPSSGSGWVYVYWTSSGPVVGSPSGVAITIAGSGQLTGSNVQNITAYPVPATNITDLHYSSAAWDTINNRQPLASSPALYTNGTGLTATPSTTGVQFALDTTMTSIGTGTANYIPRWNGNSYTFGLSAIQDNGSGQVGVGGAAASGYTLQAVGNSRTVTTYMGATNSDPTNTGSAGFCLTVNGSTAYGCQTVTGASGGGGYNLVTNQPIHYFSAGSTTIITLPQAGGVQFTNQSLASLGTCNGGAEGTVGRANDLSNAITWGTTATNGGSSHATVVCNPSGNWVVLGQ